MKSVVRIEFKRILRKEFLFIFLASVFLLSVNSSYQAVKNYEIWDEDGFVASGEENLRHGRVNAEKKSIEEAIAILRVQGDAVFVDETNIAKLVALNYSGKDVRDLSDRDINLFFENRLNTIKQRLNENSSFSYTESEKEHFIQEAGKLTNLTVGFSEGWKVLNRDMGSFISLVLFIISIILMPLFADDTQTQMKELNRSTKKGKNKLDIARILTAFGTGTVLYFIAVFFYFFIKMLPFGFSGGSEYIQSNEDTFFSVFHITYMGQFLWNFIRGYVALLFVVSMTILVSAVIERIMAGVVVVCFYWVFLLLMEKMMSFDVNHLFANFMPLRLVDSTDFYIGNEIYRFAGKTFDSIMWCPIVALLLSGVMVGIATLWLHRKTIGVKII